jgi:hypothetical protein
MTSPLPRECATTVPHQQKKLERVRRIELLTKPWQGLVLPLAPYPQKENPGADIAHHNERPTSGGLDHITTIYIYAARRPLNLSAA